MIKLVAIDLDGTLLNEQKLISDENKQALAQAKQQGVQDRSMYRTPLSCDGALSARITDW